MGILSGLLDALDPDGKSVTGFVGNLAGGVRDIGTGLYGLAEAAGHDIGEALTPGHTGYQLDDIGAALPGAIVEDYKDRYGALLQGDFDVLYDRPADFGLDALGAYAALKGAGLAGKGITAAEKALAARFPSATAKAANLNLLTPEAAIAAGAGGLGGLEGLAAATALPLPGFRTFSRAWDERGGVGHATRAQVNEQLGRNLTRAQWNALREEVKALRAAGMDPAVASSLPSSGDLGSFLEPSSGMNVIDINADVPSQLAGGSLSGVAGVAALAAQNRPSMMRALAAGVPEDIAWARQVKMGAPVYVPEAGEFVNPTQIANADIPGVTESKYSLQGPEGEPYLLKPAQSQQGADVAELYSVLGDRIYPGRSIPVRAMRIADILDERRIPGNSKAVLPGMQGEQVTRASVQPWLPQSQTVQTYPGKYPTGELFNQFLAQTPLNMWLGNWDVKGSNTLIRDTLEGPVQFSIDHDLGLKRRPAQDVERIKMMAQRDPASPGWGDERTRMSQGFAEPPGSWGENWPGDVIADADEFAKVNPQSFYDAVEKIANLPPSEVRVLAEDALTGSMSFDAARVFADRVVEVQKVLPDYLSRLMKSRPDDLGTLFRDFGAIDPQLLKALGAGAGGLALLPLIYGAFTE